MERMMINMRKPSYQRVGPPRPSSATLPVPSIQRLNVFSNFEAQARLKQGNSYVNIETTTQPGGFKKYTMSLPNQLKKRYQRNLIVVPGSNSSKQPPGSRNSKNLMKRVELGASSANIKVSEILGVSPQELDLLDVSERPSRTESKRMKMFRSELAKIKERTATPDFQRIVNAKQSPAVRFAAAIARETIQRSEAAKNVRMALIEKARKKAEKNLAAAGSTSSGKILKTEKRKKSSQSQKAKKSMTAKSCDAVGSPDLKEMFLNKGIFAPRGYQFVNDSLHPLNRGKAICLEGCRYDVVRRIAIQTGFKEVPENDLWNIIWTDIPITLDKALEMRRFQDAHAIFWGTSPPLQKANHFPGMSEICRKDRLARNLNRMRLCFPTEYDFYPRTWSLPADISELLLYGKIKKNETYICKPDSGCQGRGIFLIRNLKKLSPFAKQICQVYIPRPFLIDGYKFDLRIYILITSCDPLRIYIYNEGIARFATVKYERPNDTNTDIIFMHLTNYSLNKFSQSYVPDPEGSKRKFSSILKWMALERINTKQLLEDIDTVIVKTMIAAQPTLRHYYRSSFPKHDRGSACFEILGFDILLDHNLKPYLLEVNHSPSFNLDLPVDAEIKEQLLRDTFNKIYLGGCIEDPVSKSRRKMSPTTGLTLTDTAGHSVSKALETQFQYEMRNKGNFRLIYPNAENATKYAQFFDQSACPRMVDLALLARRREDSSRIAAKYGYPPLESSESCVLCTRTIGQNGVIETSQRTKHDSYIKVPYDPIVDDNEADSFQQSKNFFNNSELKDDPKPDPYGTPREALQNLKGQALSMDSSLLKNVVGKTVADVPRRVRFPDSAAATQQLREFTWGEYRKPSKPSVAAIANYNNEINEILSADIRNNLTQGKKGMAKEILRKVQTNNGNGNGNAKGLAVAKASDNLVKGGVNSFAFKFPARGRDLASSLSPSLDQYPPVPNYPGDRPPSQAPEPRSVMDKMPNLKIWNLTRSGDLKTSAIPNMETIVQILDEVRHKHDRKTGLMSGDKSDQIQQWIKDGEKSKGVLKPYKGEPRAKDVDLLGQLDYSRYARHKEKPSLLRPASMLRPPRPRSKPKNPAIGINPGNKLSKLSKAIYQNLSSSATPVMPNNGLAPRPFQNTLMVHTPVKNPQFPVFIPSRAEGRPPHLLRKQR